MNDKTFEQYRSGLRRLMAEKSLAEINAMINAYQILEYMSSRQRQHLIDDMRLMADYKSRTTSYNAEFEEIIKGFDREF